MEKTFLVRELIPGNKNDQMMEVPYVKLGECHGSNIGYRQGITPPTHEQLENLNTFLHSETAQDDLLLAQPEVILVRKFSAEPNMRMTLGGRICIID